MSVQKIDFKGKVFYVGLDVHKMSWSVCIRHDGMILKKFRMNPSPHELYQHLSKNYPGGRYRSVYEAGFSGYWIHRELRRYGIENIVANPADIPTSQKEEKQKTDARDASKLSRELENRTLAGIYIPESEHEQFRSLCRLRYKLVQSATRAKSRLKGHLLYYGIKIPSHHETSNWSSRFMAWLDEISKKGMCEKCICPALHNRGQVLPGTDQASHERDAGMD